MKTLLNVAITFENGIAFTGRLDANKSRTIRDFGLPYHDLKAYSHHLVDGNGNQQIISGSRILDVKAVGITINTYDGPTTPSVTLADVTKNGLRIDFAVNTMLRLYDPEYEDFEFYSLDCRLGYETSIVTGSRAAVERFAAKMLKAAMLPRE